MILQNRELQLVDHVVDRGPLFESGEAGDAVYTILNQDEGKRTRILLANHAVVLFARLHDALA